ncbi:CaiB/BaiF CoA transferase family protein [Amycolatopsis thermoflava]|uniref:Formyl-CoA transferase/CoA:oxalate CoA-transferase n=1 Tax=Amycolatopsis thermoflava TaxID=84480 RepID=A0A3N2GP72_9PSEU|nr:CoA transferase [Amycolatopsis thermoflava]ROS38434.1 formyl-CoA transferase/CoA:oxalate CoA-transferase [Amycolatopsis thermoflava]
MSDGVLPGVEALSGVRIVDFSRQMAAPLGTAMLSDFGADVVKIESMPHGDPSRQTGKSFLGDESALFLMWNRGKRSVAVDLRTSEGMALVRRLVAEADVVVESYRPGVADKIGIGYEALKDLNPNLIYCSLSAFGPTGPLAGAPGTDPVVQALSGVMSTTGEVDGDPLMVGVPIADFTGAHNVVIAVLLGLLARDRTGAGQKIDVPMLSSLVPALTTRLASYWADGIDSQRFGAAHSAVTPYELYHSADGMIVAGTWAPDAWPKFCDAVGQPSLVDDPRFKTNLDRIEHRAELKEILVALFVKRTTAEWAERFRAAGALFGEVSNISDVVEHPQVAELGVFQKVMHPTVGELPQVGPAILMGSTPGSVRSAPPLLGQHTAEVLREAGVAEQELAELSARGVIGGPGLPEAASSR